MTGHFVFQILEDYNENNTPMNLVLFDDALEHLTRVHRVLRMDRGHALLVGVGGSGKQSLCRLASYAAGCEVFEIMLSRGYNENSFRDDLKILYNKLGIENKKIVFLFTDQHVVEEGGSRVSLNHHASTLLQVSISGCGIKLVCWFVDTGTCAVCRFSGADQQHAYIRHGASSLP